MKIFDLSPEQSDEVEAIELDCRGRAMLLRANLALAKAEHEIQKAETDLGTSAKHHEHDGGDMDVQRQRSNSWKAEGALEYGADPKIATTRRDLDERFADRARKRLTAALKAKQAAMDDQNAANKMIRRAKAMTATES